MLFKKLYLLKKLCLHIARKHPKASYALYKFFTELFALQELWIYDSDNTDPHPLSYDSLVEKLKFLKRLVIKSRVFIPFLDYKCFGLAKYFETRRFKCITMRYEEIPKEQIIPFKEVSIFEPLETKLEKAWEVFREYRSEMPYDHKAHKEIYITKQIKKIKFEELNFFHNKCFCTRDFVKATWDFLMSENSKQLKKLSIKSCVLQTEFINKNQVAINLNRKYPLAEIVANCPFVDTLELMLCSSCNVTIIDAYPLICKWKNLEKLTLEVPPHLNGSFLVELTKSCTKLKLLRIISYNTNENLNRNTYKALPFATQLQDFCFENRSINLPVMFESLSKIRSEKLRRVFISCDHSEATSLTSLETFLEINPQLVLLFVAVQFLSKTFLQSTVQQLMNKYKKDGDCKQFYAKTDARNFIKNYHVCEAEEELFNYDSAVSTVNFYDFR